jgi:NTE family protein
VLQITTDDALRLMEEFPLWKRQLADSVGLWQSERLKRERPRLHAVGMLHLSPDSRSIVRAVVKRLERLGESVAVFTDRPETFRDTTGSVESVLDENQQLLDENSLRNRIAKYRDRDRILLCLDVTRMDPQLTALFCRALDRVYWFAKPQQAEALEALLTSIVADKPRLVENMRCVWITEEQQPVAPLAAGVTDRVERDFKCRLPQNDASPTCHEERGIAHLVHDLRQVKLGIALSGGAAHCMAHLGVLKALENAGVVVDAISGTSAGAMTGIVYAAGLSPDEAAESFAHDLTPSLVERWLPRGDLFYLLRKYRRREWDGMLRAYLHDWQLQQLLTPVSAVAVDLVSGNQHVRDRGDAVQAIVESINIPGLSPPICREGMAIVDGGVLNNVPADQLVSRGADFVIAVDVGAQLPEEFSKLGKDTPHKKRHTPSAFATLFRSLSVQSHQMNTLGAQPADFRIEPDVSRFALSDFRSAVEIARVGQETTERTIDELCEALKKLDPSLVDSS